MPKDWTKDSWKNPEWRDKDLTTKKLRYNVGNEVKSAESSVWNTRYRRGTPYTDGHVPCGYWSNEPYVAPSQPYGKPSSLYVVGSGYSGEMLTNSCSEATQSWEGFIPTTDGHDWWVDAVAAGFGLYDNSTMLLNSYGEIWGAGYCGADAELGNYTPWGCLLDSESELSCIKEVKQEYRLDTDWARLENRNNLGWLWAVKTDGSIWKATKASGFERQYPGLTVDPNASVYDGQIAHGTLYHPGYSDTVETVFIIDATGQLWEDIEYTGEAEKVHGFGQCRSVVLSCWDIGSFDHETTSCFVIKKSGSVYVRGSNNDLYGHLIFNTDVQNNVPAFIKNEQFSNPHLIRTHFVGTYIITSDKQLWYCGRNWDGLEFGSGEELSSFAKHSPPIQESTLATDWEDIWRGKNWFISSIGLKTDHSVWGVGQTRRVGATYPPTYIYAYTQELNRLQFKSICNASSDRHVIGVKWNPGWK